MNSCNSNSLLPLCIDEYMRDFAETIVDIHDELVNKKGFNPKLTERQQAEMADKVISAIAASFCTIFGTYPAERYRDIFCQIADFATHLSKDHIFPDGNKRTTVVVSMALLRFRGILLDIEDNQNPENNEIYRWIEDIVTSKRTKEELAEFLRCRAVMP